MLAPYISIHPSILEDVNSPAGDMNCRLVSGA